MLTLSDAATCPLGIPVHFRGPYEGQLPLPATTYHDVTSLRTNYETDPQTLATYIPDGFELTQPVITVEYLMSRGVEWLGGVAYNLIAVNAPVVYIGGSERLEGQYALVVWENKTAPILTGREQTGIPKVFADITDLHQLGDSVFTTAGYEGLPFLRIDFQKTRQLSPNELTVLNERSALYNWFGWRYLPKIGRPGAALSHATLFPQGTVFTAAWTGDARLQWEAPLPERHPTQAHIIRALSQLPINGYRDSLLGQGSAFLRNDLARPLP